MNISIICLIFSLLVLVAFEMKKKAKLAAISNILHVFVTVLLIVIPVTTFLCAPRYTLKQAVKIVDKDLTNELNTIVESEFQFKEKKDGGGNLLVCENYKIMFKSGEVTYTYIFDPLTGSYSKR